MSKYWRSPWPRGLASNKSFKSLPCLYLSGLHGGARKLKWPRFGFMPKKRMKFGREWHCTTLKKMDSDLTCISNYWRSPCPRGLASNKSFKSLPCQVFTEELGNWNGHNLDLCPNRGHFDFHNLVGNGIAPLWKKLSVKWIQI